MLVKSTPDLLLLWGVSLNNFNLYQSCILYCNNVGMLEFQFKNSLDANLTYSRFKHSITPSHCFASLINLYSVRRLIGSRIIESAAYCNQIIVIPLYT